MGRFTYLRVRVCGLANAFGAEGAAEKEAMTLRDCFAGQALIGLLASSRERVAETDWISSAAYEVADRMLSARG